MGVEGNEQALEDLRSKIIASMGKSEGPKEQNKRTAGESDEMHIDKKQRAIELPRGPRGTRNVSSPKGYQKKNAGDYPRDPSRQERSRYQPQSSRRPPPSRPNSRTHGRYQNNMRPAPTSVPLRFREEDLKDVMPIDERPRMRITKWDLAPKEFENVPAERAKLSGIFPQPGQPQELDRDKLERVAGHGGTQNRRLRILFEGSNTDTLLFARLACKLVIFGVINLDVDRVRQYMERFVRDLNSEYGLKDVVVASSDRLVMEFNNIVCTTMVLSCKSFITEQLGWAQSDWQRPREYVQQLDSAERLCGPDVISVQGLQAGDEDSVKKELLDRGGVKARFVNPIFVHDDSQVRRFTGCALVELEDKTADLRNLQWFRPNESRMRQTASLLTFQGLPKVAIDPVRVPSRVLLLLNLVDPLELKVEKFAEEIEATLKATLNKVDCIRVKRPTVDFRLNFEHFGEGAGNVYVKFQDVEAAEQAMGRLPHRTFNGRSVLCCYIDEGDFDALGVL